MHAGKLIMGKPVLPEKYFGLDTDLWLCKALQLLLELSLFAWYSFSC
jgi:hypothetical protein